MKKFCLVAAICFTMMVGLVVANPVKSMLGADGAELIEGEMPTALDYVQDGLVFHFDGIENVGYGEHSDVAAADLISRDNLTLADFVSIEADCLSAENPSREWFPVKLARAYFATNQTIEVVFQTTDLTEKLQLVLFQQYYRRLIGVAGDSIGVGLRQRTKQTWYSRGDMVSVTAAYEGTSQTSSAAFVNGFPYECTIDGAFATPSGSGTKVGYGYFSQNVDSKSGFSGKIYSIRIYDRVLSPMEVECNYIIDKMRYGL